MPPLSRGRFYPVSSPNRFVSTVNDINLNIFFFCKDSGIGLFYFTFNKKKKKTFSDTALPEKIWRIQKLARRMEKHEWKTADE